MAVGYNAQAGATGAFAFGYNSSASGAYATGLGYGTVVAYAASIGLGANATPTVANQLMLGGAGQYISNITTYAGTGGTTVNLGGYSLRHPHPATPGIIQSSFNTSADATWSGNLLLYAGDYTSTNAGKRLGVQIQSNGSSSAGWILRGHARRTADRRRRQRDEFHSSRGHYGNFDLDVDRFKRRLDLHGRRYRDRV